MKIRNKFAAVVAVTVALTSTAAAEPITVVSWGGSYGQAQDNALFKRRVQEFRHRNHS